VTDARYLREVQYRDDANLSARQSIYAFQRPHISLWASTLELAMLRGDESVLDVGCGNGSYLGALHRDGHRGAVFGMDMSEGMLPGARGRAPEAVLLVGDAQSLPFPDGSFDRLLATHMLYHVPDRSRAISEFRRVLRPEGTALITTNSVEHLRELDDLVSEAAASVANVDVRPMHRSMQKFSVESAPPELKARFASVDLHRFESQLFIPEVEPILAYVLSMRALLVAAREQIDAVIARIRDNAARIITRDGAMKVRTRVGCFVCRGSTQ
jgi:SAM-dependent methyltransferase